MEVQPFTGSLRLEVNNVLFFDVCVCVNKESQLTFGETVMSRLPY